LDTITIKQTIKNCRYVLHRKQWVSKTLPGIQRINRKEEEEEQQQQQLKPPEVSVALCHDHVFATMVTVQQDHS